MFEFLRKIGAKTPAAVAETQRQTVERALGEVNEIIAALDVKPAVRFDPASGAIALELPEQMPDEALALPAPEPAEEASEEAPAEAESKEG